MSSPGTDLMPNGGDLDDHTTPGCSRLTMTGIRQSWRAAEDLGHRGSSYWPPLPMRYDDDANKSKRKPHCSFIFNPNGKQQRGRLADVNYVFSVAASSAAWCGGVKTELRHSRHCQSIGLYAYAQRPGTVAQSCRVK